MAQPAVVRSGIAHPDSPGNRILYLVSASPTTNHPLRFPLLLYRLKEESIDLVRTVIERETGTEWVVGYPDERVLVAVEYSLGRENREVHVVPMNRPWQNGKYVVETARRTVAQPHFFRDGSQSVFAFHFFHEQRFRPPRGFEIETGQPVSLPWESFRDVRVSGAPGPFFPGDLVELEYTETGQVRTLEKLGSVAISWPGARTFGDERARLLVWSLNNVMIAAEVIGTSSTRTKELFVLDKRTNTWTRVSFPGDLAKFKAFGSWLVGYAAYRGNNVSPGIAERRQEPTETGYPLDAQLSAAGVYLPGKLYLYNAQDRRRIDIETGQGDSEVLLVEGSQVIYRVNRRVVRATLTQDGVEDPEILIESDDRVPDIHWAFWGPPFPDQQE